MSELKSFIVRYNGKFIRAYEKTEADKVITEKDKEIQRLENLCESYRIDCDNIAIRESNAYKEIERADKKLRHQKYKRCLAMARWCETKFAYYLASCDRYDNKYVNKKAGHFYKWKYKWLELAERFKEEAK